MRAEEVDLPPMEVDAGHVPRVPLDISFVRRCVGACLFAAIAAVLGVYVRMSEHISNTSDQQVSVPQQHLVRSVEAATYKGPMPAPNLNWAERHGEDPPDFIVVRSERAITNPDAQKIAAADQLAAHPTSSSYQTTGSASENKSEPKKLKPKKKRVAPVKVSTRHVAAQSNGKTPAGAATSSAGTSGLFSLGSVFGSPN
jgi:hypothetical protein